MHMTGLIRSEILKLRRSWVTWLSAAVSATLPLLALAMTLLGGQAGMSGEPRFVMLLRQNHIFLTLLTCNLLSSLIAANLFVKEHQHGTLASILSAPVGRFQYILAKEIVLFCWILCLGLLSWALCLVLGLVLRIDGLTGGAALTGLLRYAAAAAISFIPLQLVVLVTVLFRSMVVSLGVSIVALVGSIVAFNTKTLIFAYPYSVAFVLTNYAQAPAPSQATLSLISLSITAVLCLPAVFLCFRKMDVR
jgi:hypothetical protein